MTAATNVGRVFRLASGDTVQVVRDVSLYGDPLHGMVVLPLGPAHEGMENTIWSDDLASWGAVELSSLLPVKPMARVEWSCPRDRNWKDDGISVVTGSDKVTISVSQEKAMDSYNDQVETSITLNRRATEELIEVLRSALGKAAEA